LFGYVTARLGFCYPEKNLVCRKSIGTVKLVYFFVSFGYLLFRTVAVSLCAASIYDESRATKDILYAVPTQSYKIEVLSTEIII
jgi:hypothetical protein